MEDEKVDPIFIKGFEHGYWLERGNSADLKDIMNRAKGKYQSGLKAGQIEAQREKFRNRTAQRKANRQNEKDMGMDRD